MLAETTDSIDFNKMEYSGGICKLEGKFAAISYVTILILLGIVSTLENLVVVVSIYRYDTLRTNSITLFGVLATIDLITGCIVTPLKVWTILSNEWIVYDISNTFKAIFIAVINFSFSTILMITFNRVSHTFALERYRGTKSKIIFRLLLCWVVPLSVLVTMSIPHFRYSSEIVRIELFYFSFCVILMIVCCIGMIVNLRKHKPEECSEIRLNCIQEQKREVSAKRKQEQ